MCTIDGTQYHNSKSIHCDCCLTKEHRAGEINMVKEQHPLPTTSRCELLKILRSTSYYQPKPVATDDLELMERIERIYTAQPFRGSHRIVDALADQGLLIKGL